MRWFSIIHRDLGVTGVDQILKNIEEDTSNLRGTFSSRFQEFRIRKWVDSEEEEYISLLMNLHSDLNLASKEEIKPFYMNKSIREELIELTNGLLGRIIHLIKETAIKIIENEFPESITLELLRETAEEGEF